VYILISLHTTFFCLNPNLNFAIKKYIISEGNITRLKLSLLSLICYLVLSVPPIYSQTYHTSISNIEVPSTQSQVTIPINVAENLTGYNITSYQGVINWDDNVIGYAGHEHTGTLSEPWGVSGWTEYLPSPGKLNFGQFVAQPPLDGSGIIVNLIFNIVGNPGDNTSITFNSFYLNAYPAITTDGSLTINIPPTATGLGISPTNPKTNNDLVGSYTYNDGDNDPEGDTQIRWYKDNVLQTAYNDNLTVSSSATSKGDQWYFTVKPHDGLEYGSLVSSSTVTIANTAPTATNLSIAPANPKTNNDLVGSYTYNDVDNDPEGNTEIRWYKNNVLQSTYNDKLTVPSSATSKGEQWRFTIKPHDGSAYGALVTSSTITIGNTAPSASNLAITPTNPLDTDDLVGSYTYNDIDNDSENGSEIRWYKNGIIQSTYNNLLRVPSSATSSGDQWYFTVKPKDGTDFGTLQTSPTVGIGANISGKVNYAISGIAVKSTLVTLSGGSHNVLYTGTDGNYEFAGLAGGLNYTITPSKTNDYDIADINMYDASLAAQHAVQLITLTTNQQWAADVDKDDLILMYDASLIAMCAVELTPPAGSYAGKWEFNPTNRNYIPLTSSKLDQNYNAVLFGDVDGNWVTGALLAKGMESYDKIGTSKSNFEVKPGEMLKIPFMINKGQEIYSADVLISYDPTKVKFKSIIKTNLSQDFHLISNIDENILRFGIFGIKPIKGEGEYLTVQFEVIGKIGEVCSINLERFQINNGPVYGSTFSVSIIDDVKIAKSYSLRQNYPNPFNPETVIMYDLANNTPQRTIIVIYNLKGEIIKTLVDREQSSGTYEAIWDGTDNRGIQVTSGIYLYKITSGSFKNVKKMIKTK